MSIDSGWSSQAITALDMSAMAATDNIANASTDDQRNQAMQRNDYLGGTKVPFLDVVELTISNSTVSDGPAFPLRVSGGLTDYDTGLIRPVASNGEGSSLDQAREYLGSFQQDQAFSANFAALNYTDDVHLGRIVDYTA